MNNKIIVKTCLVCLEEFEGYEQVPEGYCPDCDVHDEMNQQWRKDIESGLI